MSRTSNVKVSLPIFLLSSQCLANFLFCCFKFSLLCGEREQKRECVFGLFIWLVLLLCHRVATQMHCFRFFIFLLLCFQFTSALFQSRIDPCMAVFWQITDILFLIWLRIEVVAIKWIFFRTAYRCFFLNLKAFPISSSAIDDWLLVLFRVRTPVLFGLRTLFRIRAVAAARRFEHRY